jgi:NhaA family Na+:H+ antiporter
MRRVIQPLRDFLHRESASGVSILIASALGLIVANSPLSDSYFSILDESLELGVEPFYLKLTVLKLINYLLMTIFFFVVGLEIKRELTSGHLMTFKKAIAPFLAAVGGMAIPALIYLAIAGDVASSGWGVAVATDIALAVGLLAILGRSVSPALRTFLLALAVIDDIGAILVIALVYSAGIATNWFIASALLVLVIFLFKKLNIQSTFTYIIFGIFLWYFIYRSGMHPTLAGVVLGLMTPNIPKRKHSLVDLEDNSVSVIEWLEHKLHPVSSFAIVPLFAFANTGVVITLDSIEAAYSSKIAWGIFFGLVAGKPIGIFVASYTAKKFRIAEYPEGSRNIDIISTGSAAGIGFTVAIFVANLAFTDRATQDLAIFAVIIASLVSGLISVALFRIFRPIKNPL